MADVDNGRPEQNRGFFYWEDMPLWLRAHLQEYEAERKSYWEERLIEEEWTRENELRRNADEIANSILGKTSLLAADGSWSVRSDVLQIIHLERQASLDRHIASMEELLARVNATPGQKQDWMKLARDQSPRQGPLTEDDIDVDRDRPIRVLLESIRVTLTWEALDQLDDSAFRTLQLAELLVSVDPAPATAAFLKRIARCYVMGFDAECVILCRSALDTAFRETVPERMYTDHGWHVGQQTEFDLWHMIEAACPGILDQERNRNAHAVRERGNKAVHDNPDATDDILGTIRMTLELVETLAKWKQKNP
jgi:hypothetical protein